MSAAFDDDEITARQVTPLTVAAVAAWCGGTVSLDAAGDEGIDLSGGDRAGYGTWVTTPAGGGPFAAIGPVEFRRTHLDRGPTAG